MLNIRLAMFWQGVRQTGGGKKPYGAYLVLLVALAVLLTAAAPFSVSAFASGVATVYAVLYVVTTLFDRTKLIAEKKETTRA